VIVKTLGVPTHPFAVGVTVMVAISGAVPVFVAVNEGMTPVPFAANPTDGVSFVHEKVVPATGLPGLTKEVVAPLQYVASPTGLTVVVGYTVIVNESGVPVHPFAVGVTAIDATTGTVPVLMALNGAIFPAPAPARPIDGVLLVHAKVVPATGLPKVIAAVVAPLQ
jgi:hypothetical protein